jgi:hypothetical protein
MDKQDKSLAQVRAENQELRSELERQWRSNHAEYCERDWPHDGECLEPPPAILGLTAASPQEEVSDQPLR